MPFRWFAQSLRRKIIVAMMTVAAAPAAVGFWLARTSSQAALERNFNALWEGWVADDAHRLSQWIGERAEAAAALGQSEEIAAWLADPDREGDPPWPGGEIPETLRGSLALLCPQCETAWRSEGVPAEALKDLASELSFLREGKGLLERPGARETASAARGDGKSLFVVPLPLIAPDGRRLGVAALALDFYDLKRLLRACPPSETALVRLHGGALGEFPATERASLAQALNQGFAGKAPVPMDGRLSLERPRYSAAFCHQVRALSSSRPGEGNTWFLATRADLEGIVSAREKFLWQSMLAGLATLALAYALAATLANRITEPLRLLREDARALASGKLDSRVEIATRDELALLAADINAMAENLSQAQAELERSVEEARRRAGQLGAIAQITAAMTAALSIEQTFANFSERLKLLECVDHCGLSLLGKDGETFRHMAAEGFARPDNPFPDNLLLQTLRHGPPRLFNEAKMKALGAEGLKAGAVYVLATKDNPIGTLNLASRDCQAFGEEMADDLGMMAEGLAAAIRHDQLYAEARDAADHLEQQVRERTRELEETHLQLLRSEKFAATGQLAANLAHEINNPLGIVRNHLQLIKHKFKGKVMVGQDYEPTPEEQWADIMAEEIDRIARLTRSLLNFYRSKPGEKALACLDQAAEEVLFLACPALRKRGIEADFAPAGKEASTTWTSPDQFRQALMNLLRNAEDAIEEGSPGQVKVSLRRVDEPSAEFPAGFVEVSVRDNGKGMAPEHLDKIFDPFFTTKSAEKGTGLGLSVTYGIMSNLGGSIEVESAPGQGSTFRLLFPVREAPPKTTPANP